MVWAKTLAETEELHDRVIQAVHAVQHGNYDVNDAECLNVVGLPVVPSDAWPEVVPLARWVLERQGGYGCVRELCDAVWLARSR